MPRFPIALQPACEYPGTVLEEPPAEQDSLLFQIYAAPVDLVGRRKEGFPTTDSGWKLKALFPD
jgi:hypothetical protein